MKTICNHTYEEYLDLVRAFHGHLAPGMVIGGFMVDAAQRNIPEGELFDAVCETRACLPDAIQILTPCTIGNGWLTVLDMGLFALTLFEKFEGRGVRVFVDPSKLEPWPEVKSWFFKLKPKREQNFQRLLDEIYNAGAGFFSLARVEMKPAFTDHARRKGFSICPECKEAYPSEHGPKCRSCQGRSPYAAAVSSKDGGFPPLPELRTVNVEDARGLHALHDMTRIIPGEEKGPAFRKGQQIQGADVCRLQKMGRTRVYTAEHNNPGPEWVHEDEAAQAFAQALAGDGIALSGPPREGKVELLAARSGLLMVDTARLEAFNTVPGVACAGRHGYSVAAEGCKLAGTRALPLYLRRDYLDQAMRALQAGPVYSVRPMRRAKVGLLVTGTEVFQGIIRDKFTPIMRKKVEDLGSEVVQSEIVPDEREAISGSVRRMLKEGVDLIITTAGLSVDPDDVTRHGLMDAGVENLLYGAPILPGNMTLLADIGGVQVLGVPACALFHPRTSCDLLLPRLLAGVGVTRADLAKMGHGSYCLDCEKCVFPQCGYGK